jgi:hypothetical protein
MVETVVLTDKQAAMLAGLSQQAEQAAKLRDVTLTAICAGHDLENVVSFSLTGRELTVTLPDPA